MVNFGQTSYVVHASRFSRLQGGKIQDFWEGGEPYVGGLAFYGET